MYVSMYVCMFVCMSLDNLTLDWVNEFLSNFAHLLHLGMGQFAPMHFTCKLRIQLYNEVLLRSYSYLAHLMGLWMGQSDLIFKSIGSRSRSQLKIKICPHALYMYIVYCVYIYLAHFFLVIIHI